MASSSAFGYVKCSLSMHGSRRSLGNEEGHTTSSNFSRVSSVSALTMSKGLRSLPKQAPFLQSQRKLQRRNVKRILFPLWPRRIPPAVNGSERRMCCQSGWGLREPGIASRRDNQTYFNRLQTMIFSLFRPHDHLQTSIFLPYALQSSKRGENAAAPPPNLEYLNNIREMNISHEKHSPLFIIIFTWVNVHTTEYRSKQADIACCELCLRVELHLSKIPLS